MKKFRKPALAFVLLLVILASFTLGTVAATTLQAITAHLNYGITIQYDGEAQIMRDAVGTRVYPISYNGTTYVPIRAVSNMLGISVDWDQASQTVLLGNSKAGVDLIDTYKAYALDNARQIQSSAGETKSIGGVDVNRYLYMGYYGSEKNAHFNLGGKYTELTFQVYAEDRDVTLEVYGDNGSVLDMIPLTGDAVPKTVTIPLLNTTELFFHFKENLGVYIFDAKLK